MSEAAAESLRDSLALQHLDRQAKQASDKAIADVDHQQEHGL
jgi:hypothetical protein